MSSRTSCRGSCDRHQVSGESDKSGKYDKSDEFDESSESDERGKADLVEILLLTPH